MTVQTPSVIPWYKQFWPWFIIALPATVVVAGTAMIFVAFKYADNMVVDNYYKEGLAINQTIAQDVRASELGLSATVTFDAVTGEVFVAVDGELASAVALELLLLHPVDERSDQQIALRPLGDGRFRADIDTLPKSRFYLRLQPAADGEWRLNGEVDFRSASQVTLAPDV